jgi:hypothetical protein
MKKLLIMSAAALVFSAGIAAAQTTTKKAKAPPKPRSEASIACSQQANEQGLKGKPRKAFRAKCIKTYKKVS